MQGRTDSAVGRNHIAKRDIAQSPNARPPVLTMWTISAMLLKLHCKSRRETRAQPPGGGHRDWSRQPYHHADRRCDRRLAGRADRAWIWIWPRLEHRHRYRRRL